jgi:hypothetical protein
VIDGSDIRHVLDPDTAVQAAMSGHAVIDGHASTGSRRTDSNIRVVARVGAEAEAEAFRLSSLARLLPVALSHRDHGHTAISVFRSHSRRASLAFWFFHARIVNGSGRLIEEVLLPIQLPMSTADLSGVCASQPKRRDVSALAEQLIDRFRAAVTSAARSHIERRVAEIAGESRAWVTRALARERRLSRLVATDDALFQAGLFETRLAKHREDIRAQRQRLVDETTTRAGHLELDAVMSVAQAPELVLLLIHC